MLHNDYYDYKDLREAAISPAATQDDINALGRWFEHNGQDFWNGEHYDADNGYRLFPVYKEVGEPGDDVWEISGYEFR